jgi:hypothetical protein
MARSDLSTVTTQICATGNPATSAATTELLQYTPDTTLDIVATVSTEVTMRITGKFKFIFKISPCALAFTVPPRTIDS